jgi:hypothetical protein
MSSGSVEGLVYRMLLWMSSTITGGTRMNPIVMACRKREYSGSFQHTALIIEPFDAKKIKQYLQKHWELYIRHFLKPEARHTLFGTYMQISQPDHPLFHFATNPFSLKLLAKYFFKKGGQLPQEQAEIFQSYLSERLRREVERGNLSEVDTSLDSHHSIRT